MHIDIAALTSKGQFTIPGKFRDLLRLSAGSKMIIICDGEHLLLKPIKQMETKAFQPVIQRLRKLEYRKRRSNST